jgi:hypothetical protein
MRSIFINPELTKFERTRDGKLRAEGKKLKSANTDAKVQLRNGIMHVTIAGIVKQYTVNDDGFVTEM